MATPLLEDLKTEPILPTATISTEFETIINHLTHSKNQVEKLEKEIAEVKANWLKDQKQHEQELAEQRSQEEIVRKRDKETYDYEISLARKKSQDEFEERKTKWERELQSQKDQIEAERKELAELRKTVEKYPEEKDKMVKEAVQTAERSLRQEHDQDKKFLLQEHKAETDLKNAKIASLEAENGRQAKEIESLRKSLDEVSQKFQTVAVKAIEATRPEQKPASQS